MDALSLADRLEADLLQWIGAVPNHFKDRLAELRSLQADREVLATGNDNLQLRLLEAKDELDSLQAENDVYKIASEARQRTNKNLWERLAITEDENIELLADVTKKDLQLERAQEIIDTLVDERDAWKSVAKRFRDGWLYTKGPTGYTSWRKAMCYPTKWQPMSDAESHVLASLNEPENGNG